MWDRNLRNPITNSRYDSCSHSKAALDVVIEPQHDDLMAEVSSRDPIKNATVSQPSYVAR